MESKILSRDQAKAMKQSLSCEHQLYREIDRLLFCYSSGIHELSNGCKINTTENRLKGGFFQFLIAGFVIGQDMGMIRGRVKHLENAINALAHQVQALADAVTSLVGQVNELRNLLIGDKFRNMAEKCQLLDNWVKRNINAVSNSQSNAVTVTESIMNDTMYEMVPALVERCRCIRFEGDIVTMVTYLVNQLVEFAHTRISEPYDIQLKLFCETITRILTFIERLLEFVLSLLQEIVDDINSVDLYFELSFQFGLNKEFFSDQKEKVENLKKQLNDYDNQRKYKVCCNTKNKGLRYLEAFPSYEEIRPRDKYNTEHQKWKITLTSEGCILTVQNVDNGIFEYEHGDRTAFTRCLIEKAKVITVDYKDIVKRGTMALEAFPREDMARVQDQFHHCQDQRWFLEQINNGNQYRIRCRTQNMGDKYLEAFPIEDKVRMRDLNKNEQDQLWFFNPALPELFLIRLKSINN